MGSAIMVTRMFKLQYCVSEVVWERVGGADVEVGNADLWGFGWTSDHENPHSFIMQGQGQLVANWIVGDQGMGSM